MADYRILDGFRMSLVGAFLTLWSGEALAAADLKGRIDFTAEDVLVSGEKPYTGQFDLRDQWGEQPRLTLTRLVVTFYFRDDDQWQMKERRGRPEKDGRPLRTMTKSIVGLDGPALEQHYIQQVFNIYSNPPEVARLRVGADRYFAATSRRRLEKTHDRGESRSFLGLKQDPESGGKLASYSITQRTLVEQWDGFADEFTIRGRLLGLDALRDLAEDGVLEFTLDGEGDYLFVGATLDYEGYAHPGFNLPGEEQEPETAFPSNMSLGMISLLSGGGLVLARRQRKQREKDEKIAARVRYGERRREEIERLTREAMEAVAEVRG